jgi:hypothetical protein
MNSVWKMCAAMLLMSLLSLLSACGGGGGGGSAPNVGKGAVDFVVSAASEKAKPAGVSLISSEAPGNARPLAVIDTSVHNVRVVVKNSAGVSAGYTLSLSNFSGTYISDPLSLEVGSYTLESYEVRNSANVVLYATPKTGSSAASAVSAGEALPKAMTVTLAGPNRVTPQIVSTTGQTPATFGFSSFSFNLQESITFQVGANTWDGTTATRVAADISVTADGVQVYSGSIAAAVVASITIKESVNAGAVYVVTVSKSGYTPYVLSGLSAAQLKRRLNGNDGGDGIIDARLVP